jgi:xanthine dehydrogenase accessory factor
VYEVFEQIPHLRDHGDEAVLVTVVDREGSTPAVPGAKMLVYADGSTVGTVGGGALEHVASLKALERLRDQRCLLVTYLLGEDGPISDAEHLDMACGGRVSLFYDYIGYQGHVFIFGAGHVGRAIAYHFKGLRYHVSVVDHRQEMLGDLEGADRLILAQYDRLLHEERVPQGAFHVIATPSHAFDYVVLREVFASNWQPRYVGMLASRRKAEGILQRLVEELGDQADLDVVYCPVGLDLGGRSPDDIAIAVVAEILALRHGRTEHRHMRLTWPGSPA